MGKPKDGVISAQWESAHVHIFCDICIQEIELGNRPNTHFSRDGWLNLIKNFKERTTFNYTRAQLKNKWDQLKREWKLWRDLKRGETGLGWNPTKRTIDASDEWWEERIKMLPAAKKFRYTGIAPELEEKMDKMFSLIVATGEQSWIPSMGEMHPLFSEPEPISDDDDHVVESIATPPGNMNDSGHTQCDGGTSGSKENDIGSTSKMTSGVKRFYKGNKKEVCTKDVMMARVDGLLDVTRSVGLTVAAPIVHPSIFMLSEAVHELEKFPELFDNEDLYDFATLHFINLSNRIIFMNLPVDRKVSWLKKRYMESLK